MATNTTILSTDDVHVGENTNLILSDHLDTMATAINNKAASNHSHFDLATAIQSKANGNHTHTAADVGALPTAGGTVTGDVTFRGKEYTQQIIPFDAGSYSIGNADRRYYSTYLRVSPNVSSDKRLKRDIAALNAGTLAEFVNKLAVVSYNYNDDAEDEAKRIGLIAQDVISADSEIARFFTEQSEKGFYSLRPADLVFPLIAAVQQLSARIAVLESE